MSSQIIDLNDRLHRYEGEIDQIMLGQCMESLSPSGVDRASILRWLSGTDDQFGCAHPAKLMSKAQVAEFAVLQAVTKHILASKDGPIQRIGLDLSQPALKWAEENLGTSLSLFLDQEIADRRLEGIQSSPTDVVRCTTFASRQLDFSTSHGRR